MSNIRRLQPYIGELESCKLTFCTCRCLKMNSLETRKLPFRQCWVYKWFKVLNFLSHGRWFESGSHCSFSSNSFHGQIIQKAVQQVSDPENKKGSPWKVFGTNHPQTLWLLSRRGPRSPDMRLSQHYICLNFCRKKFPGLTKEIFCTYWRNIKV